MISFTCSLARQLRAVFRKAGIKASGSIGSRVLFDAGPNGLRIRARQPDAIVEYLLPGVFQPEQAAMSVQFLKACEGNSSDIVTLENNSAGRTIARWQDAGIPQLFEGETSDAKHCQEKFPDPPRDLLENPPAILDALQAASDTANRDAIRYALNSIALRGDVGEVVGTDGYHLLVQAGYQFPWTDMLLVPRTSVFGCPVLLRDEPVRIGRSGDWVAFRVGLWTMWSRIDTTGRYPKVGDILIRRETALATVQLGPADAEFLEVAISRLPDSNPNHHPVTLDINGRVAVRAKPESGTPITELVLTGSRTSGEPACIALNRLFFARALRMGFRDFHVAHKNTQIQFDDGRRQYVCGALCADDTIQPCDDAVRIETPRESVASSTSETLPKPKPARRHKKMSEAQSQPIPGESANDTSQQPTNGRPGRKTRRLAIAATPGQPARTPMEQAIAAREALRSALSETNELIRSLKRQKKHSQIVESALGSLRQLQSAAG